MSLLECSALNMRLELPDDIHCIDHGYVPDVSHFLLRYFKEAMPGGIREDIEFYHALGFPMTGYHFWTPDNGVTHHIVTKNDDDEMLTFAARARYESSLLMELTGEQGLMLLATNLSMGIIDDQSRLELIALPPQVHRELGVIYALELDQIDPADISRRYHAQMQAAGMADKPIVFDATLRIVQDYRHKLQHAKQHRILM